MARHLSDSGEVGLGGEVRGVSQANLRIREAEQMGFTRIVLPLSLPALLTFVVVNALYVWNDLIIAIIFLQDDAKRTLMAGISVYQGRYEDQIPLVLPDERALYAGAAAMNFEPSSPCT